MLQPTPKFFSMCGSIFLFSKFWFLDKENYACLVASNAQSHTTRFFYMGNHTENEQTRPINGPIMVIAWILKMIIVSTEEVKVGVLFYNACKITIFHIVAIKMGQP